MLRAMTSKAIAGRLAETGLCVFPNFLSARRLLSAADDLDRIRAGGQFHDAGIGRRKNLSLDARIRNDSTFWLEREQQNPIQAVLWRKLDLLKSAINRSLFLGLDDFEGHYAVYREGGFYGRHKDCFRGDSGRIISFVLYLNRAWKPADGGRLRVYAAGLGGAESHTDVDPVGGTMVCFLSGESEHEVLLSHRERFSFSGWFKRSTN